MARKSGFNPVAPLVGLSVQARRLLTGSYSQTRYTRYLESIQWLPEDELKKIQASRLCDLMSHAVWKVPYYKCLKSRLKLTPESAFEDILEFPVVTKGILAQEPKAFIDPAVPVAARLITGGTSNVDFKVIRDSFSANLRNDEYFNRMTGIYPGKRRILLSWHESNYMSATRPDIEYKANRFSGTYLFRPTPLTEEVIDKIYRTIVLVKPYFIKGNINAIMSLAIYIKSNGLPKVEVPVIRGYGSRMMPYYREFFKEIFNAEVFDSYGSTESNYIASECSEHDGLHYSPSTHFLESVKPDGSPVKEGGTGSILITSLVHRAMPIVRYEIGDYVSFSSGRCGCKRTFPRIRQIAGRSMESIMTDSGPFSIMDLEGILSGHDKVMDFQATETAPGVIELRLVCG
ncbi:MAG: phenylacetate--CoA ligase family protein, partial [Clostridia bacterium]|nr:phenylacetate--CoA ligase family protein [Clostridia bacterium]